MNSKSPLILFITPVSKSIVDFQTTSLDFFNNKCIETHELDSISEAKQLLDAQNPSITFLSSVKKCAKLLKQNQDLFKATHSQVILITKNHLPRHIVQALYQMGLTQLIEEPTTDDLLLDKVIQLTKNEDGLDLWGIEVTLLVLSLYMDHKVSGYEILRTIEQKIYENEEGITAFFMKKENTLRQIHCAHQKMIGNGLSPFQGLQWHEIKNNNLKRWSDIESPTWSTTTYSTQKTEFCYPYFHKGIQLGLAVVHFPANIKKVDTSQMEIMLESAKGCYLDRLSHNVIDIQTARGFTERSTNTQLKKAS